MSPGTSRGRMRKKRMKPGNFSGNKAKGMTLRAYSTKDVRGSDPIGGNRKRLSASDRKSGYGLKVKENEVEAAILGGRRR